MSLRSSGDDDALLNVLKWNGEKPGFLMFNKMLHNKANLRKGEGIERRIVIDNLDRDTYVAEAVTAGTDIR